MKKHVMMAFLLGAAVLAAGCSGKTEKKTETEAQAVTEDSTKTESAEETEAETQEAARGGEETEEPADTSAEETDTEADSDPEEAEEETDGAEVLTGERPEYDPLEYVTLGTYKGLSVILEPITVSVTDEEVDLAIRSDDSYEELVEKLTSGAVQSGDIANIDYVGKVDGEAFEGGSAQGSDLEIGSNTFIDGFEDGLVGVNVGDTVDLTLTFPEDYRATELAGKETVFTVTVNYISRRPELSDEVVREMTDGEYTVLDDYREHVREELYQQKMTYQESLQDNAIYSDLMAQLYNTCTIDSYPEEVVEYNMNALIQEFRDTAKDEGMEFDEFLSVNYGITEEELTIQAEAYARQNLDVELILLAIAEKEGMTVSEEEYRETCERYMDIYLYQYMRYFANAEELEAEIGRDTLERYCLMDKVLDFVKDNAVIEEAEPESETENASEEQTEDGEPILAEADSEPESGQEETTEAAEFESEQVAEAVAAEPETAD